MLTLYVKTGCPYSAAAIEQLRKLDLPYEEKNIADPDVARELIDKGGKRQVPYMTDEDPCESARHLTPCLIDNDVEMYESANIVKYLADNYAPKHSA